MTMPPLIAHVVFRLDVGGLENGVVNLINRMPPERYRHAVVSLTEATDFKQRIQRLDVPIFSLHKREGKDLGLYLRLWKLFRALKPDLVHTRNLATLEAALPAALAGVPYRVHGEHGWDMLDPYGRSRKYSGLRRAFRPLVDHYIPLSRHIEDYLRDRIGVPSRRLTQIYNGVDARRFQPAPKRAPLGPPGFAPPDTRVIGTVGRMQAVKDPLNLVKAFLTLREQHPCDFAHLRLVMIGNGPLRERAQALIDAAGCREQAWLPGGRDAIPELLRGLDLFVLPSLAEGISNTILEAMATGLPVVATRVGGNPELVVEGVTGALAEPGNPEALAAGIATYLQNPELMAEHGKAARWRVEQHFTLERMVDSYLAVYDRVTNNTLLHRSTLSPLGERARERG